jgi:hypothetical protein
MSLLGEVHTVYLGFHFHCIPHFVPKRYCVLAQHRQMPALTTLAICSRTSTELLSLKIVESMRPPNRGMEARRSANG